MTVCTESIEFKLAAKEVRKLEVQGFGYYQCVQSAIRLVVSQGFGQGYYVGDEINKCIPRGGDIENLVHGKDMGGN